MTKNIQEMEDFRTEVNKELGFISGVFMSQGDIRAGDIVMPTQELLEALDRICLYNFKALSSQRKEIREMIEEIETENAIRESDEYDSGQKDFQDKILNNPLLREE